jgi:hypothetical protein
VLLPLLLLLLLLLLSLLLVRPGPKAWPVGMALISFFAWCAFLQALVADISTPVAL